MTPNRWRFIIALLLFFLSSLSLVSETLSAEKANIFIYHRFGESRYPSTNIDADVFADHLQYLHDSGKKVLPLKEVVRAFRTGEVLPSDAVVLTVDDAFDSFLAKAMPLLKKYRYPVTLFVNTDGVGSSGYLDWDQLRHLARNGVDIGNHTATHDYLLERKEGETGAMWESRIRDDITRAQDAFDRELGMRPELFAYTYGEYSPELVEIVRDLGFIAAVAQQSGVASPASDLFLLPRFPMGGPFASLSSFKSKVNMQPLDIEVLDPQTPIIDGNNPPILSLRVRSSQYDLGQLQGFVQGNNDLDIKVDATREGVIVVQAEKPLTGRRNKYTLTAPLKDGSGWAWFSQPWFRPDSGL